MVWLLDGDKKFDDMLSRFDEMSACDEQTNGQRQTSCHGIVHAIHNIAR